MVEKLALSNAILFAFFAEDAVTTLAPIRRR